MSGVDGSEEKGYHKNIYIYKKKDNYMIFLNDLMQVINIRKSLLFSGAL